MLEIALVVIGLVIIGGSYVISERVESKIGGNTDVSQVREIWTDKDEKRVRERIDSILVESVEQAVDKTEYELSRISNEKIMHSNEFSEQVLAKIEQNHEEVVFLYNMLSEKEKQMKSLMQEIETLKTAAEEMARKEEEALKAERENAESSVLEKGNKEVIKPVETQLKIGTEVSPVQFTKTDEKELSDESQKKNYLNHYYTPVTELNDYYYINYGFCVKDIHNDLQYPKNNECDITGRFLNETNKGIYQLDSMNAEELVMSLEKNILNFIVPVINEGISKYFELFPNAICRATLNLKKYLGIN